MNKCEDKDKKSSIEKVHTFCNDLNSKESIKEKPPIYLLATLVDINREKNQEAALKVNYFCACFVKYLMSATFVFWDSVYNLFVICVSQTHESFLKVLSDVTIFESCSFVTTWPRSTMWSAENIGATSSEASKWAKDKNAGKFSITFHSCITFDTKNSLIHQVSCRSTCANWINH